MLGNMRPRATAAHLERRRRRAIQFWRRGKPLAAVARRVGAGKGSVWRWIQTYRQHGPQGLRAKPIPGRPSYLSEAEKGHLASVLLQGARAAGYRNELWTLERIAKVVWRQFRVRYHPRAIWRLLRTMGWSCQKPERRSCQRDEAVIAHWRRYRWPHIKKGCTAGGAPGFPG
jgi:transposase